MTTNGKPPGTTSWDDSITTLGTRMESYYGRPVVKEPVWQPEIPGYFFTGGISGASAVMHVAAKVAGYEKLERVTLYVGAATELANPLLLISDLGRPERFHHMLRVFKVTSPMSVGSWLLFFSSGATLTSAFLRLVGILKPVQVTADVASAVLGGPLATYTGALIANTSIPVWSEARHELPVLFGTSALASAGSAALLFVSPAEAGPARRLAVAGAAGELVTMEAMQRRLGFVGEVYKQGQAGTFARVSKLCAGAGAALLAARGGKSRVAAVAGASLLLAGELALRWSVFRAGFQSARDPRYTVIPQRERKRQRAAAG
jgi:formate-dependent nitrite reductase membrane component NrfD